MLYFFFKYFMVYFFFLNNDVYILVYRKLNFMKLYKNLEYNANKGFDWIL